MEELPSDTVVEGSPTHVICIFRVQSAHQLNLDVGHYRALEWDEVKNMYIARDELGIQVDVDVRIIYQTSQSIAFQPTCLLIMSFFELQEMATDEPVVRSRGPNEGRFTFTSHEAGDHSICLSTNYTSGWFSSKHIKLYLDLVAGATKRDVEHDRSHVGEVAGKIRELNERLGAIRREQQYQREREAQFRDMSERTNSRALWYTVVQILVLVATCTWQLRHLKVSRGLLFSSLLHEVIIYRRFFLAIFRGAKDAIVLVLTT